MKTVNKEDVITITVGDLFTACYDAAITDSNTITSGSDHADAHNLADNALALALKKKTVLCLDCSNQVNHATAPQHNCVVGESKQIGKDNPKYQDWMCHWLFETNGIYSAYEADHTRIYQGTSLDGAISALMNNTYGLEVSRGVILGCGLRLTQSSDMGIFLHYKSDSGKESGEAIKAGHAGYVWATELLQGKSKGDDDHV